MLAVTNTRKHLNNFVMNHMIEILLLVMIIAMSIGTDSFFTSDNLLNVLRNAAMRGVIAFGMCLVIVSGEIDISVGSQVALCAVITANISLSLKNAGIMPIEYGVIIGVLVAIGVSILIGLLHAWARHFFNMPSLIVTLATMNIMYGVAAIISDGFPITNAYPDAFIFIGAGKIWGIPFPVIVFIIVFILFWFLTEKTDLGRSVYAVGGNAEAARLSGISVWRTRLFVMVAVQVMCVLGGLMNSAQVRSATFGFGRGWELQIISAVVIGGTSMLGGIGTIRGTLVGILFITIITNSMTLLNVNPYLQYVVHGGVMFLAVLFNMYMRSRLASKK